jgi:hypothetical protein
MSYTLDLEAKIQNLFDMELFSNFKGFIFNNNLITVHHWDPIVEVSNNKKNLDIVINCMWNELLILSTSGLDLSRYINIENVKLSIPKKRDTLILRYENEDIYFHMEDVDYFSINKMPGYSSNMYIKARKQTMSSYVSYSGCPVFSLEEELLGILCKQDDNYVYILPSYYIVKTLTKNNNSHIYSINYDSEIIKVNSNIVKKDETIKFKTLNYPIKVQSYLILEGDEFETVKINDDDVRYTSINHLFPLTNERKLLKVGQMYKVNATLLNLIKKLHPDVGELFNFILRNSHENLYITLYDGYESLFRITINDHIIHFISI